MRALHFVTMMTALCMVGGCSSTGGPLEGPLATGDGLDAGLNTAGVMGPCVELVASVCGEGRDASACHNSVECESARLLQAHEPELCSERLSDPRYVDCEDRPPENNACDELVLKCCGSELHAAGACTNDDACHNARDVAGTGNTNDCFQALGDMTLFPACPGT